MHNFKVGDVCITRSDQIQVKENIGKIFTLVRKRSPLQFWRVGYQNTWEADTEFKYGNGNTGNFIGEAHMRKLDNPGDDVVDEMITLVGKAPAVKEITHAVSGETNAL